MDWVALWKVVSIVATGLFGVLGLLTQYKDKEGRITGWGKVSLAGIVLSTTLGAAVQVKELNDKAAAAARDSKQMLEITQKTQKSVDNLERLLQPLDAPSVLVQFPVPCENATYAEFCATANRQLLKSPADLGPAWEKWPSSLASDMPHQAAVRVRVSLRAKRDEQGGGTPRADWTFDYKAVPAECDCLKVFGSPDDVPITISIEMQAPTRNENTGAFQSILDLEGADMTLSISTLPAMPRAPVVGFKPNVFTLEFRNGRKIRVPIASLHEGRFVRGVDRSFKVKVALQQ